MTKALMVFKFKCIKQKTGFRFSGWDQSKELEGKRIKREKVCKGANSKECVEGSQRKEERERRNYDNPPVKRKYLN